MSLIVQKFGGTSVANAERVMNVAKIVTDTYAKGNDVVVVVSAQGDFTDVLVEKQQEINPNDISVTENISVIAAVGRKMASRKGTSGEIFATLGKNGINIRMISQGAQELNIIVGVDDKDFANTVRVLYNSFVK